MTWACLPNQVGINGIQMVAQLYLQQRVLSAGQKVGGDTQEATPKLFDLLTLFRPLHFDFPRGSKTNHHSSFLNGVNRSEIEPPVGCFGIRGRVPLLRKLFSAPEWLRSNWSPPSPGGQMSAIRYAAKRSSYVD